MTYCMGQSGPRCQRLEGRGTQQTPVACCPVILQRQSQSTAALVPVQTRWTACCVHSGSPSAHAATKSLASRTARDSPSDPTCPPPARSTRSPLVHWSRLLVVVVVVAVVVIAAAAAGTPPAYPPCHPSAQTPCPSTTAGCRSARAGTSSRRQSQTLAARGMCPSATASCLAAAQDSLFHSPAACWSATESVSSAGQRRCSGRRRQTWAPGRSAAGRSHALPTAAAWTGRSSVRRSSSRPAAPAPAAGPAAPAGPPRPADTAGQCRV